MAYSLLYVIIVLNYLSLAASGAENKVQRICRLVFDRLYGKSSKLLSLS